MTCVSQRGDEMGEEVPAKEGRAKPERAGDVMDLHSEHRPSTKGLAKGCHDPGAPRSPTRPGLRS